MQNSTLTPPVAPVRPHPTTIHGETRPDDYYYLREKENADVLAYLHAENDYAEATLAPLKSLEDALYAEMLARIQETDLSVPYRQGDYWYYSRTQEGKQYPIYCRKAGSLEADEQVTLDMNALAEGEKFLSVSAYAVSDDGNLLAYTTDVTGFREYTLFVKDLRTGALWPDRIEKVDDVEWASDNATLFYTREDDAKRPHRVYRHTVGTADAASNGDALIYEENDALYRAFMGRTRDRELLFVGSASSTATEYHYLRSDNPTNDLTLIVPRDAEHEYYVDHRAGQFFIRTNRNAVNFRLVTVVVDDPAEHNWQEVLPHRPEIMLEDHDCFARHLVVTQRINGLPNLRVQNLETGDAHDVSFPEPTYNVTGDTNRVFDTETFRFRYASLITPQSVFDYDMGKRERVLLKETPVLGGYDRTQYVSERVFAVASDGTPIPISLVYRKGLERNGEAPCLLYGYGSYGISIPAGFNSGRLSLLDRGFVFAIAHIRGGGELGKPWHDAGKMAQKMNTFMDFIACAEHLIRQKYTSAGKLAVMGASAGGLLMGAVTNLRPDLFHTVLSIVPFVDVLNTMLDNTLPLTVGEYLEWGNPNIAEQYSVMRAYCPYTNLHPKAYPTLYVRTSLNDSQVMYWEPAKYVAKLRTLKTDSNPLLFRINMDAGHGGASGRYDALRETAQDYAFVLGQMGLGE